MIALHRCAACFTAWHPARVLCPACGAADWREEACEGGVVEECTTVAVPASVVLASVRCPAGPAVIAAVPSPLPPGTAVRLRPGPGRSVLAASEPGARRLPERGDRG